MSSIIYSKIVIKINETFHISLRNHLYLWNWGIISLVLVPNCNNFPQRKAWKIWQFEKICVKISLVTIFITVIKCMQINDVRTKRIHLLKTTISQISNRRYIIIYTLALWPDQSWVSSKLNFHSCCGLVIWPKKIVK